MNLWQQEIEAAVVCEWDKAQRNESRAPLLADVLRVIRALPEPDPPSEEELVEKMLTGLCRVLERSKGIEHGPEWTFKSEPFDGDNDRELQALLISAMRAALRVVREHDRREAEEMQEVLRAVLDAPVVVNDDGATVRDNLEIQRSTRDLRARADRLAKVGP